MDFGVNVFNHLCNIFLSDHKTFVYQMTKLYGSSIKQKLLYVSLFENNFFVALKTTAVHWYMIFILKILVRMCNICVFCSGMSQYLQIWIHNVQVYRRREILGVLLEFWGRLQVSISYIMIYMIYYIYIYIYTYPPRICDSYSYFTYISLMSNSSTFRCICSTQFCNK